MSEQREELRLALVMNGGVSLAVWMGGVTNEIFRLVKQRHSVYAALLDLTQTTARVDVISGTSAGGINGAALSLALLYDGDFQKLRDVWLETGEFAALLRPPLESNPSSLLMGEDYFLPQIEAAFKKLAPASQPVEAPETMPIDLRLTTTLLRGKQGRCVDDLGAEIHDVDYRAQFRFRHTHEASDFALARSVVPLLARAARSSASFPFAFEPSPVEGLGHLFVDAQDQEIERSTIGALEVPRFVVDGGVLNNKPFRGALKSIFGMPTQHGVRRVLAYINPDPGDGPPGLPMAHEPPLSSVMAASLFGIPQSQSIADQLAEIQAHNDHVRGRRNSAMDTLRMLADAPQSLDTLPRDLFAIYRRRRLISTFDDFVYSELPAAARRLNRPPSGAMVGQRGRGHLLRTFLAVPWAGWIPKTWPSTATQSLATASHEPPDADWEWGLYPVEFAIKVTFELLRRTQQLLDFDPDLPTPESKRADAAGPVLGQAANDVQGTWDPDTVGSSGPPLESPELTWLAKAWRALFECVDRAEDMREAEQPTWERNAEIMLEQLEKGGSEGEPGVDEISGQMFEALFAFLVTPQRRAQCGSLIRNVAQVILQLAEGALPLVRRIQTREGGLRQTDRAAAAELASLLHLLTVAADASVSAPTVMLRLMQLEVIEHANSDHDELDDDCLIELVQISGNAASPVGGPVQARDKLLGLQLAHFGAFYKQAWRANDWTYGRLDGSERLVKILLNPERLRRFVPSCARAVERITDIALTQIPSPVLKARVSRLWIERNYSARLSQELAFLDNLAAAVPDALPIAAEVVTLRLHFGILREEIYPLLGAIAVDRGQGADAQGASDAFADLFAGNTDKNGHATRPFSPEQVELAMNKGLIAKENLSEEAGSDLFTRTLAHTVATLESLLASKAAALGPVSLFFAALKAPVLGFYFVARGLTQQSRTSAALHGAILAIGLSTVLTQMVLKSQGEGATLPGPILSFGWALLAYGLLFSVVSSPRSVAVVTAVGAAALWVHGGSTIAAAWGIWLGVGVVLWLSVRVRRLAFLQWPTAVLVTLLSASWANGWNGTGLPRLSIHDKLDQMALLVCFVLLLAGWQASCASRWIEGILRGAAKQAKP